MHAQDDLTRIHHACDSGLLSILVHLRSLHWKAQIDSGVPRQLTAQAAQCIWPEDCQSLPVRTQGNAPIAGIHAQDGVLLQCRDPCMYQMVCLMSNRYSWAASR